MIANIKILRPDPQRFFNDVGESERQLFILDGDHLVEAGIEDSQALIDSYADSCDLNLLIERVSQGEYDLLCKTRGVFIDTTMFPSTVAEIRNSIRENRSMFDSLPDDVKSELKSFDKFAKMSDEDFASFIESHKVKPDPVNDNDTVIVGGEDNGI